MVPIFINCAAPPLPSPKRCYAVGRWLADAIGRWDSDKRVAILATGGLSHSVGSLQQGWIDEDFDHRFLGDFCAGRGEALAALSDREIAATGSATGEITELDRARRRVRRPHRRAGDVRADPRL